MSNAPSHTQEEGSVTSLADAGAAEGGDGGEVVGSGEDVGDAHDDAGVYEFTHGHGRCLILDQRRPKNLCRE